MEVDKEKIESILGVIQLKNSLKDEDRIQEEHLREAVGGNISNELYYLHEHEIIELKDNLDQNYVAFTEDTSEEVGTGKPLNLEFQEIEEANEGLEVIDNKNLLEKGMEIEQPEKYVATLKPFGEAIDYNPTITLSEEHITSYVGEDISFELTTLAEWGYLEEVNPEKIGISNTDSNFYRLNIDDKEVQADAAFSSMHIEDYYNGSIEKFLNEYSERDSDALRKNGVKFYKAVG